MIIVCYRLIGSKKQNIQGAVNNQVYTNKISRFKEFIRHKGAERGKESSSVGVLRIKKGRTINCRRCMN